MVRTYILLIFTLSLIMLVPSFPAFAQDSGPSHEKTGNKALVMRKQALNSDAILIWASATAAQTLTFDHDDYQQVFTKAKRRFTTEGWNGVEKTLGKMGISELVVKYKQTIYTHPNLLRSANLLEEREKFGVKQWVVSVPLVERIQVGDKKSNRLFNVTMTIVEKDAHSQIPDLLVQLWQDDIPKLGRHRF